MKYKKIVDISTGVRTKISDTLEGRIEVEFDVRPEFLKPINHDNRVQEE